MDYFCLNVFSTLLICTMPVRVFINMCELTCLFNVPQFWMCFFEFFQLLPWVQRPLEFRCRNCRESNSKSTWWRHQMETFSASLAICAGNSPVPGEFPAQWPVTRSFDVFFDLRLNKRLSKQPWGWWFETPAWSLWRHRNDLIFHCVCYAESKYGQFSI